MKTLRQYDLVSDHSQMTTWLENVRLRPGDRLTLKDAPKGPWTVQKVYHQIIFANEIKRGWDNNI